MYEHVWREFLDENFGSIDEIIFVVGNSIPAGTEEWKQRRKNDHQKGLEIINTIRSGRMPQSMGKYG